MPFELKSPYPDDETRTRDVCRILEDWIEDKWDVPGVDAGEVAFGKFGDQLIQSGKQITLRCYTFFTSRTSNVYGRKRWAYQDGINIDVYVLNNDWDDQRDPRGIAIMKWLEELAVTYEGDMPKGIYSMIIKSSDLRSDPENSRITHPVVQIDVTYIADLIQT